jgi:hypothetical protein
MTCARGHFVPDKAVSCPACAEAKSDDALRAMQAEFLRKAVNGEFGYSLRITKDFGQHVMMYTSWERAFCGAAFKTAPKLRYEAFSEGTLARICPLCRSAVADAVREAFE